jgi:hypothetical protein
MDPYISLRPLDSQAWAQNQTMIPLDDDMPLKKGNPTDEVIVAPTILSEIQYTFS